MPSQLLELDKNSCVLFNFNIKHLSWKSKFIIIIIMFVFFFLPESNRVNPYSLKEIAVKIADLGSSCWVVSIYTYTLIKLLV